MKVEQNALAGEGPRALAFVKLLTASRLVWQLAIVMVYAEWSQGDVARALYAVVATLFIVSNVLLFSPIDHQQWPAVQGRVLLFETLLSATVQLFMMWQIPAGPGALLMLPTVAAYTWVLPSSRWSPSAILVMVVLFALSFPRLLNTNPLAMPFQSAWLEGWSLVVLYGVILLFGTLLAHTLQWQRMQQGLFQATLRRVQEDENSCLKRR